MIAAIICGINLSTQAQVKVCMSYDDFAAGKWKPYDQLTPDKEPDTCNVKYDGIEFTIMAVAQRGSVSQLQISCPSSLRKD